MPTYYLIETCSDIKKMIPGKLVFNTLDEMLDYITKNKGNITQNMVTFPKSISILDCRTCLIQEATTIENNTKRKN
jgi:hypothetical protein